MAARQRAEASQTTVGDEDTGATLTKSAESEESLKSRPNPFAGGGIAAAAAMAARQRADARQSGGETPLPALQQAETMHRSKRLLGGSASPRSSARPKRNVSRKSAATATPESISHAALSEPSDTPQDSLNGSVPVADGKNPVMDSDDEDFPVIGETDSKSDRWAEVVKAIQMKKKE